MYPFLRLIKDLFKFRKAPQLGFGDVHISHHMCMPWDLDPWIELNNGRTLTLYDLGRIPLAARSGLLNVLKERRWGMTMAGACVRYRRRIFHQTAFGQHWAKQRIDPKFQNGWQPGLQQRICAHGRLCRTDQFRSNCIPWPLNS
jgi:hypothetical protein